MSRSRKLLFALGIVLFGAIGPVGVSAQDKADKPVDLKPLIPPVFQLPPNSQLNPGSVGGTTTPYSTAAPPTPSQSSSQPAPGIKLSIPTR